MVFAAVVVALYPIAIELVKEEVENSGNTDCFKMTDVAAYFNHYNGKKNRNGWYLQQILKLYIVSSTN